MKVTQFIILLISLVIVSCSSSTQEKEITTELVKSPLTASEEKQEVKTPNLEINETSFDFGEITQGESVTHDFVIKNTGEGDLIISAAKGSCGCTVPEWPKGPITKGEEATIKVTFNSEGKLGMQNKTVTLVTNAIPNTKILTMKGNIIIPEKK